MVRIAFVIPLRDSDAIVLNPPASLHDCLEDSMAQDEPPAVHVSHHTLFGLVPARPKYESSVAWPLSDLSDCGNWIPVYATSLYDSSDQCPWGRSIALIRTDTNGSL